VVKIKELILSVILDNNFDIVELAWSSGMAWWMASLLFCATLTSRLYLARESLVEKGLKNHVGILVSICFMSMIIFGVVVIHDLTLIEASMYEMLIHNGQIFDVPNLSAIFIMVKKLYTIITATIIVFLLGWLYVWFYNKPFKLSK
jgi:hypothetical protein